jgi:hypothetical protein
MDTDGYSQYSLSPLLEYGSAAFPVRKSDLTEPVIAKLNFDFGLR